MTIRPKTFYKAGELTKVVDSWTDDELKLVIKTTQLALSYLEGKGPKWNLATTPLRMELERYRQFASHRGLSVAFC